MFLFAVFISYLRQFRGEVPVGFLLVFSEYILIVGSLTLSKLFNCILLA